jgi:hypothetical protein
MHPGGAVVHEGLVAHGLAAGNAAGAARLESVEEYRTIKDESAAMPDILQPIW